MSKLFVTATVATVLAAATPIAYAQTHVHPDAITPQTQAAINGPSSRVIQSDQVRASMMIGSTVYDMQNRDIGTVKDLVLDKDGRVAQVVVDVGSFIGIGGKNVAINWSDIKTDNNRLTADLTKEQLQQMAEYRPENRDTGAGTSTSPVTGAHLHD
jgi:sporulation protein YlmC with PRC-barrel domain